MRRVQTLLLTLVLIPMAIGGLSNQVQALADCPNAPATRLAIGMRADVTTTPAGQAPSPLHARDQASAKGKQIKALNDGDSSNIVGGPTCAAGYEWWQIKTDDATTGWVAEGSETSYFIEQSAAPTPIPTVVPTATPLPSGLEGQVAYLAADPDSPKGAYLVQLHLINADGSQPRTGVTPPQSNGTRFTNIQWSPDGSQFIATIQSQTGAHGSALLINRDGSVVMPLPSYFFPDSDYFSNGYSGLGYHLWSPDSRHILLQSRSDPTSTLLLYNPPSDTPIRLTGPDSKINSVWWLPDSQHILIERAVDPDNNPDTSQEFLSVIDSQTGKMTDILTGMKAPTDKRLFTLGLGFPNGDQQIAHATLDVAQLTPDGETVYFTVHRCVSSCDGTKLPAGELSVYSLPLAGGQPVRFIQVLPGFLGVALMISPDAKYFGYSREESTQKQWHTFITTASGTGTKQVLPQWTKGPDSLIWSPDSQHLLISAADPTSGSDQIYLAAKDGSHAIPITLPGALSIQFLWAPDSQHLAICRASTDSAGKKHYDWYVMAADGLQLMAVKTSPTDTASYFNAVWSPNSQYLAFASEPPLKTPNKTGVFTFEIKTGNVTTLSNDSVWGLQPYAVPQTPSLTWAP